MNLRRKFIYDFGVSQDDPLTELRVLDPKPGDRILCIASAGEVPIELLVNTPSSIKIDAVDIAESQLFLSNLKLKAAISLEPTDAARFLGYLPANRNQRETWLNHITATLPDRETQFWNANPGICERGPIHLGRYETYIARFAPVGRWLLGGKQVLLGLFDCGDIDEQKNYFDHQLRSRLLKNLFRLMFNRRLYRKGGIAEKGSIHMSKQNIGLTFYKQFRNFCTDTPVRENWMLQFVLFDRVLYEDALPAFLHEEGARKLRNENHRLRLIHQSYNDLLATSPINRYNLFAFSNISDWQTQNKFAQLMHLVAQKAAPYSRGLLRYIHSSGTIPSDVYHKIASNPELGTALLKKDRFPFYKLIPITVN
ncbi:MAG TPA: DUF3419 family protein [Balneolaceae bacterium]|nr:DUF3419 family protein [Balneolaceae bacterium]